MKRYLPAKSLYYCYSIVMKPAFDFQLKILNSNNLLFSINTFMVASIITSASILVIDLLAII